MENLAFDKIVGVWGHQPLGDLWTLHPGTYQRSLPGNRELWRVQVRGTPIDRFAVQSRGDPLTAAWGVGKVASQRLRCPAGNRMPHSHPDPAD